MFRATFVSALLFAAPAVLAQPTGNPGGFAPDTPGLENASPAATFTNNQDKLFVRQAAIGNRAEVELGKLAQSKASAAPVKEFAKRMEQEHADSGDRVLKAGRGAKMDIPKDLDAEHQRVQKELNAHSGADFDKAYLAAQIADHQRTANLLLWQLSYGQNAELVRYSADTLPSVLDHLEHAKRAYAALTQMPAPR